jgi:hypothetical protein
MCLHESVLQAAHVYTQRLSRRLEDHGSCNQAYQIIESNSAGDFLTPLSPLFREIRILWGSSPFLTELYAEVELNLS